MIIRMNWPHIRSLLQKTMIGNNAGAAIQTRVPCNWKPALLLLTSNPCTHNITHFVREKVLKVVLVHLLKIGYQLFSFYFCFSLSGLILCHQKSQRKNIFLKMMVNAPRPYRLLYNTLRECHYSRPFSVFFYHLPFLASILAFWPLWIGVVSTILFFSHFSRFSTVKPISKDRLSISDVIVVQKKL